MIDNFVTHQMRVEKVKKEFAEAQSFAKNNFKEISKRLEIQIAYVKYLVGALGRYTPDYLQADTTKGYKKGKIYSRLPNMDCDIVYLDKSGKLLYMQDSNLDATFNHGSYHRIEYGGYTYFLYRDNGAGEFETVMAAASFRAKYDNKSRLIEFLYIHPLPPQIYLIFSDYTYSADGMIMCKKTIPSLNKTVIINNYKFFIENGKVQNLTAE